MADIKTKVERVRGMRDVLPEEYTQRKKAFKKITGAFELFGYQGIEVPTIEDIELQLKKSGESIRKDMYTFRDQGNNLVCLRPELTASVARAYIQGLRSKPLPLKFYYTGSNYRYDRPQKGRYREFTQAGVELIGGKSPAYDAEIIALACQIMETLEIPKYEVVIGNIGFTLDLLSQKNIDDRVKGYIIRSLEDITKASSRKSGINNIRNGLEDFGVYLSEATNQEAEMLEAIQDLPNNKTQAIVSWVIETIYGDTGKFRDSDEIAKNLLKKAGRNKQKNEIEEMLSFVDKLTAISGNPAKVFPRLTKLLQEYNLNIDKVDELRIMTDYLDHYGVDWSKVKIDFGFGRGLEYYTGMIFEINCPKSKELGEKQKQVCGGGRYDSLIKDLGGSTNVPALGFGFGLERLVLAMQDDANNGIHLDAFVASLDDSRYSYAIEIANKLRKAGLRTELGPLGAKASKQISMADRLRAESVLFIGEEEHLNKKVTYKNMATGKQALLTIEKAIENIKKGLNKHDK